MTRLRKGDLCLQVNTSYGTQRLLLGLQPPLLLRRGLPLPLPLPPPQPAATGTVLTRSSASSH